VSNPLQTEFDGIQWTANICHTVVTANPKILTVEFERSTKKNRSDRFSYFMSPGLNDSVPDQVVTNGDAASSSDGLPKETPPLIGYTCSEDGMLWVMLTSIVNPCLPHYFPVPCITLTPEVRSPTAWPSTNN